MSILFRTFDGLQDYSTIFSQMREFTLNRTSKTQDEIWFLEHAPVFTQGQAGKAEHILNAQSIPIVQSDRGGQVTYHGPGQIMIYTLIDIKKSGLGPRTLVTALETTVIQLLAQYQLIAHAKPNAPGVYLEDGSKIASIGLRIRKGCCYHGISFNHHLDLSPFKSINPCGFKNLPITQLSAHVSGTSRKQLETQFKSLLTHHLYPTHEESVT